MTGPSQVLLVGHPNVGKSVLFNRLADATAVESNYPGTTVSYTEGEFVVDGDTVPVIDTPGTFSLDPHDRAEEVTVDLLDGAEDALVVGVIDATRFERGLNVVLELVEREFELTVAVNMWDQARRHGIEIDVKRVEALLGVPVVPTVATEGRGIETLKRRIHEARSPSIEKVQTRVRDSS